MSSEFISMIKYLADNLEIDIDTETEFGPKEVIVVKLSIGDTVISESRCDLPNK